MKKAARITTACLAFSILLLLLQKQAFPQQIPHITNIPRGSISLTVEVTKRMMNYYYQVYVVTNGIFPIWTVFYNIQSRNIASAYPFEKMAQPLPNVFYVTGPWRGLEKPGQYQLSILGLDLRFPVQYLVRNLRISSNTEQALKDNRTLIVNDSTGVAPRRGPQEFKIRYQLNEDSDMVHKILDTDNKNTEVWKSSTKKVVKGTRGFDWDCKDAKKEHWYRALVEATCTTDKDKWDHDLSDRFQTLK